ncbi:MAG: phosphoribosylglycinamide formyltransferase [Bacteroidetes bacterium]|nr:phosphoribosylglycinamide formyltransferase [Bacteroidota bacterium]
MKKNTRIAILISGTGSNALNMMRHFQYHENIRIALIFSTRTNEIIENESRERNIEFKVSDNNNGQWHELAIKYCENLKIDFIVLAGFLKKIPSDLINKFPNRIVNIHPSLLPKFGGKGMYGKFVHEAVISAGEKKSGITIHFVNKEFDEGEIIAQFETELTEKDSPESVADKIHILEMKYFPLVLEELLSNKNAPQL